MYRPTEKAWTLSELNDLFTNYFDGKLSPDEVERLAQDCASALGERGKLSPALPRSIAAQGAK